MEQYTLKRKWWKNRIKYLFEKSDIVICLSESWVYQIRNTFPLVNAIVIPNAVKLPAKYKKRSNKIINQVNLLFLGLIGERKGVFDLLKVFKRLSQDGYKLKLYIGGNGEVERLKNVIKELNLEESVSFLGWVNDDEKVDLFKRTDIYILPSYGEGMPMSILEAMSYGLTVISTNTGGVPELLTENETGFLIQPGDLDGMYKKIIKLITEHELKDRIGHNAREKVRDTYNLDLNFVKIDDVYLNLLKKD